MLNKIQPIAKAVVGFVAPGVVAAVAAVQDGSPGGAAITMPEWVGIVAAMVLTGGAVYAVPNKGAKISAGTVTVKLKPQFVDPEPAEPQAAEEQPAGDTTPAPVEPTPEPAPEPAAPAPAEDPVKASLKAAIEQVRVQSNAANDARAAAATAAVDNAA